MNFKVQAIRRLIFLLFLGAMSQQAMSKTPEFHNNCDATMSVRLYDENDVLVTVPLWDYLNLKNGKSKTVSAGLDGDKFYKAHVSGNCSAHIRKVCISKVCGSGKATIGNWSCTAGGKASTWIHSIKYNAGKITMC